MPLKSWVTGSVCERRFNSQQPAVLVDCCHMNNGCLRGKSGLARCRYQDVRLPRDDTPGCGSVTAAATSDRLYDRLLLETDPGVPSAGGQDHPHRRIPIGGVPADGDETVPSHHHIHHLLIVGAAKDRLVVQNPGPIRSCYTGGGPGCVC